MEHKDAELLEVKAAGDRGEFTALAAVFGNIDHGGDRIQPGAFSKTLREFRASGDPIPIVYSHQYDDPMSHIGAADAKDVKQTERGLVVKGKLDIEDNELARQTFKLMKDRRLKAWSFGYTIPEGGSKVAEDGANDLTQIDLVEAGPTLKGMNPEARLEAVKNFQEAGVPLPEDEIEDGEDEEPTVAKSTPQGVRRREVRRLQQEVLRR